MNASPDAPPPAQGDDPAQKRPLYVDLDGTFLKTDSLYESVARLIKKRPLDAFRLPLWLKGGRPHLKQQIAARAGMEDAALPINEEVRAHIQSEKAAGRRIVMASAADARIVEIVAGRENGLFDAWFASDGTTNLSGKRKRARIEADAGGPFTYAGDAPVDKAVWSDAGGAILVGEPEKLRAFVPQGVEVEATFDVPQPSGQDWLEALRAPRWIKNGLVFAPIAIAGQLANPAVLADGLAAFIALCGAASAGYLLNDLLDLDVDRRAGDARTRARPLAAGVIPCFTAAVAIGALLLLALVASAFTTGAASIGVALFFAVSALYSFALKPMPVVGGAMISVLLFLRFMAGYAVLP
ncbi:MAG: UbiA family prenyltransferase [Pseudomonadota bacterium]